MMKRIFISLAAVLISLSAIASELSQYTAVRVQKAHQLAQDEKVTEAIETLNKLDLTRAYDKAFVARMLGVFYWQNEQTKLAVKQLTYAVNSGLLTDDQAWITQRMLADVLLNEQQFKQALPHYYALVKSVPDTQKEDELWMRLAQAEYQVENWNKTLSALEQYEGFEHPNALPPLSLKLGAQLQLKQWNSAIPTLEKLILLQPEKSNWWRQLVGLQLQLEDDKAALDALSLAKLNGVELTQSDRRLLAQLYAKQDIPERAAIELSELEGANSDEKLLAEQATYWQLAKEWDKSIQVWSLASKINPKYHWNVAQLLVQEGHYRQALKQLDRVEAKDKQADIALARVRALYKLNKLENALIQAKHANNVEPSTEAKGWIKYLIQLRTMDASS
ncbi:tetratricopeptide repeat protein [Vibrio lamellibrachiae]|uniref:tetratricopeptide repeat protein n=1 Tax=Vibrio lamellibrachiae TaxID=2910253 RepID=UPI003D13A01E